MYVATRRLAASFLYISGNNPFGMGTRRTFLQTAGLLGLGASTGLPAAARGASREAPAPGAPLPLQMGIAGYTFLHVPLEQGIAMMKRVGINALSIKDFYLPLDSGTDVIGAVMGKFSAAGIKVSAGGRICACERVG
jgi:inosose dehydratase